MKCEKCNEREATFFYTSNINGEVTKTHLCSECAAQEGLMSHEEMINEFFGTHNRRRRNEQAAINEFWENVLPRIPPSVVFFPAMFGSPQAAPIQEKNDKIPTDAGEEFRAKRELVSLKSQLKKAVDEENYERAIELRDQIRSREQTQ